MHRTMQQENYRALMVKGGQEEGSSSRALFSSELQPGVGDRTCTAGPPRASPGPSFATPSPPHPSRRKEGWDKKSANGWLQRACVCGNSLPACWLGFIFFDLDRSLNNVDMSEWLRRQTRNLLGFACAGSNPAVSTYCCASSIFVDVEDRIGKAHNALF